MNLEKYTRDLYAAHNAHDLEKFLSFHTDDLYYEYAVADGPVGHGKEVFASIVKAAFDAFPDFKCELIYYFAGGNKICERIFMTGTHKGTYLGMAPTGNIVSFPAVLVREVKGDKTSRVSLFYDTELMMRQLRG